MGARGWMATVLVAGAVLAACGDDGTPGADGPAFKDVVQSSIKAENAHDADAFLALWTDKGLSESDSGSRKEIRSGEAKLGQDKIAVTRIGTPKVDGDRATLQVEATAGERNFATSVARVIFTGIKQDGRWKIDGFEYVGSPPPGKDAAVVRVTAMDYAFSLDRDSVPAGEVAFRFINAGKEQHEISLFKAPARVTLETAKEALQDVDGSELDNIPAGYEVSHVAFADIGDKADITFADPLKVGTYVLVCYLPQGGFGENGPVNPEGTPHVKLGMIHLLTIE